MNINFGKLNWRSFFIALTITFLVTTLHLLNALPKIDNKAEETSIFPKVKSLLHKTSNNFSLHQESSLISAANASTNDINASSYILVDLDDGNILEGSNINKKVPIASLTKIMTTVVALDLAKPEEKFKVSKNASEQIPTKIGVVEGENLTLEELIKAAMLTSANDAVEVIKEGVNSKYKEDIFVKAMNEKAKFIGLRNTSFDNPQGFDGPNNFSTSEDLAILSAYALNNYSLIREVAQIDYEYLSQNSNHKQFDLNNWNGLIGVYPEAKGLKIGYTEAAGTTTSVVSERSGKKLLAVVLGAPGILERDLWAADLLDSGYKKSLGLKEIGVTEDKLREKYQKWQ